MNAALDVILDGGIVHYEGLAQDGDPNILMADILECCNKSGYKCELLKHRSIKSYKPKLFHVAVEVQIKYG